LHAFRRLLFERLDPFPKVIIFRGRNHIHLNARRHCAASLPAFMMFHTFSLFFRTSSDETNKSAGGYNKITFFREKVRDLSVGMTSPPELINELSVGLKFGALALLGKAVENCLKLVVYGTV
jgi:hypothetical protein